MIEQDWDPADIIVALTQTVNQALAIVATHNGRLIDKPDLKSAKPLALANGSGRTKGAILAI